jgi:hypothetical protein
LRQIIHEGLFSPFSLDKINQTPENHGKLLFTIGISSGLRLAYYIKIHV